MKLTLIKEDTQDKNIVDEVMETHLYEDEKDNEAENTETEKELINDEEIKEEEPESDAVQDILNPEETTGLDVPEEPLPLDSDSLSFDNPDELDSTPVEQSTTDNTEAINILNNIINGYWGLIDQLKYIKINDNMVKDESQKEAFIRIADSLIDDTTISIGMLYKLLQLCSPEINVLIDKGINKADEKILGNNE